MSDIQLPPFNPRILRLASVEDALTAIRETAPPVKPVALTTEAALGHVLARDVKSEASLPRQALAYRDGWAVRAEEVVGASAYGPAFVAAPVFVEVGQALPAGMDAVLPPDALTRTGPMAEASESVPPGDGVRFAGQDVEAGGTILRAGTRLDARHIALLAACGIGEVFARRARIRLVCASIHAAPWMGLTALWLEAEGAEVEILQCPPDRPALGLAFQQPGVDGVVAIGGTGFGPNDHAAAILAEAGKLTLRGVALRPGETASFGSAGDRPVLLLPARPDGLVAGLLTLGLPFIAALCGKVARPSRACLRLGEHVSSAIGLTEIFLIVEGRPVPLAEAGFDSLAAADAWFAVPPESEGLAAGKTVQVHELTSR